MNVKPLVSCIITCYNSKDFIGEAIDSVINQTYKNIEIIVVDDHSTDGSIDVINLFNDHRIIKIFHEKNYGLPAISRNSGIKVAKGDYLAFLDGDDFWSVDKLEKQVRAFKKNIQFGIVAVGSEIQLTSDSLKIKKSITNDYFISFNDMFYSRSTALSTLMVRKDSKQMFLEEKEFIAVEDFEFQLRLLQKTKGKELILKDKLVTYRVVDNSMSSNIIKYSNILNVIERYRKYLTDDIYKDAMYLAYLKIGLKCLKSGISANNYLLRSLKYTQHSILKYGISLSFVFFSYLPKQFRLSLLSLVYRQKFVVYNVFKALS